MYGLARMLALPWNGSKVDTIGHHQGLLAQINRKITSDQLSIPYHPLQLHHQRQTRIIIQIFFSLGQILELFNLQTNCPTASMG
jgi:hypothetical protein